MANYRYISIWRAKKNKPCVFSKHRKEKLLYLLYPFAYLQFIMINTELDGVFFISITGERSRFPYHFIDFDILGTMTFAYIAGMTVAFILIGLFFVLLDKKTPPRFAKVKVADKEKK